MHTTYRSSILPLFAFVFTMLALGYSACHESAAEQKPESGISQLKDEVQKFEQTLTDLKTIHAEHVKKYCAEMGCTRDSKALEIINRHNELLNRHIQRLKFHKMQLTQADTSDVARNNSQLVEVRKDLIQLNIDGNEIKTGFDNLNLTHVTK